MQTLKHNPKRILTFFGVTTCTLIGFFALTYFAHAADKTFTPLVGLPGLEDMSSNTSLPKYINAVYMTLIGLGALVGVVRISMAGVKYSLSDVVTSKEAARNDIRGVLFGLLILLVPFIVLNTIYPNLTNLDVLSNLDWHVDLTSSGSGGGGGGGTQSTGNTPTPGQELSNQTVQTCTRGSCTTRTKTLEQVCTDGFLNTNRWKIVNGKGTCQTCSRGACTTVNP
jgi:hypothetical protein